MTIIFKYRKELSAITDVIYRPVAEVTLVTEEGKTIVPMYIDSGADIALLPRIFGEAPGFKMDESRVFELVGISKGKVPVIVKWVKMTIGECEFDARVAWALIEDVPPLLEILDVFDRFNVEFKQSEGIILFEWVGKK